MTKSMKQFLAGAFVAASLAFSGNAFAYQGTSTDKTAKMSKTATPAPTDKDIADAKTKGMVWVNTESKVYHKDGEFYGKTKKGKFMMEADAQKAGYRAARQPAVGKKKSTTK